MIEAGGADPGEDGLTDWILRHPAIACLIALAVRLFGDWLSNW